jgi:glycosyltransferase involved in cell wall biosynthesis
MDVAARSSLHVPGDTETNPGVGKGLWFGDVAMTTAAARLRDRTDITRPYEESPLDITLFVSCYNEAEYITATLDTVCDAANDARVSFEIIVIDDCSRDGSPEVVRKYIYGHPETNILLRLNAANKGLAQNYIDGAFIGKGKYYRLICGDNGEPKESIVAVLSALGQADCIVPYYVTIQGRGFWRRILSNAYTSIINGITGNRIHYYNGLAVHLRYNVMRWHPNTRGFGFQADILCLLLDLGFTYKEISIFAAEKRTGHSNAINFRNLLSVAHSIVEITNRRISRHLYPYR